MNKFTVFVKEQGGNEAFYNNMGDCEANSVQGLIDFGMKFDATDVPFAWAAEVNDAYGGTKSTAVLRAESIAAGRIIKKVDGKFVPLGVGAPLVEQTPAIQIAVEQLKRLFSSVRIGTPPALDPNANMFLHDENGHEAATAWREKQQAEADLLAAEEAKRNAPLPCPAGFGYRPDQAPTGHQFGQFKTR